MAVMAVATRVRMKTFIFAFEMKTIVVDLELWFDRSMVDRQEDWFCEYVRSRTM